MHRGDLREPEAIAVGTQIFGSSPDAVLDALLEPVDDLGHHLRWQSAEVDLPGDGGASLGSSPLPFSEAAVVLAILAPSRGVEAAIRSPTDAVAGAGRHVTGPERRQPKHVRVREEVLQREPEDPFPLVVVRGAKRCRGAAPGTLALSDSARAVRHRSLTRANEDRELLQRRTPGCLIPDMAGGAESVDAFGALAAPGGKAGFPPQQRMRLREPQNPDLRIPLQQLQELRLDRRPQASCGIRTFLEGRRGHQRGRHRETPSTNARGVGTRSTAARSREALGCR